MKRGYITLISVLVVGTVGTLLAVSLLLFGIGSARTGVALERQYRTKAFTNACLEDALEQVADSQSFEGSAILVWPEGRCAYTVTNLGSSNRLVEASSTVGAAIRRGRVFVNGINPAIVVSSWQEVAD